jgi:chromosome partitioning protein
MPYSITVANLKGGCGKSCIALNLACELAGKNTVVLVDADLQGTSAHCAAARRLPVTCEHLPLEDDRQAKSWIQRVLGFKADVVVIDCPPHTGAVSKAAIGVSDLVLIPSTPSAADLLATASAVDLLHTARAARRDSGPKALMVPSRVDSRTRAGQEIASALKRFGEPVGPPIHQRMAFVDAFSAGQWIGDYAPTSTAHADIVSLANAVRKVRRANR